MNLKQRLNYHYAAFDRTKISPDPLQLLHQFNEPEDIEIVGVLASVYAYGNVNSIIKAVEAFIKGMDNKPYKFISSLDSTDKYEKIEKICHRFYTGSDAKTLLLLLKKIYLEWGSVKRMFLEGYDPAEANLRDAISRFTKKVVLFIPEEKQTAGVRFMFPDPVLGSACKRMNLFLRWMVRKDELDFGLWSEIPRNKLVIPVDTHIAEITQSLGLTQKRVVNWKMAEEITNNLAKFDPIDPVKYDFALCHIGMRKLKF